VNPDRVTGFVTDAQEEFLVKNAVEIQIMCLQEVIFLVKIHGVVDFHPVTQLTNIAFVSRSF